MILLLQGENEAVSAGQVAVELIGFLGSYALYGAVGARIIGPRLVGTGASAADGARARGAGTGVALIGAAGALLSLATIVIGAAQRAAERHVSVTAALGAGGSRMATQGVLLALALVGLLLASRRVAAGWYAAFVAVAGLAFQSAFSGKWAGLVNPIHVLAGGLWLGTLAVLVAVLFPVLLRGDATGYDLGVRPGGSRLDAIVRRFSRLALVSSATLGVTGVITAWRHLGSIDALWTSAYGWALDIKLLIVAAIVGFGFYNWRYVTPALSAGSGDARMVRSSRREVLLGLAVLIVTGVLVSLPAPAEQRHGGGHDGGHAGGPRSAAPGTPGPGANATPKAAAGDPDDH